MQGNEDLGKICIGIYNTSIKICYPNWETVESAQKDIPLIVEKFNERGANLSEGDLFAFSREEEDKLVNDFHNIVNDKKDETSGKA